MGGGDQQSSSCGQNLAHSFLLCSLKSEMWVIYFNGWKGKEKGLLHRCLKIIWNSCHQTQADPKILQHPLLAASLASKNCHWPYQPYLCWGYDCFGSTKAELKNLSRDLMAWKAASVHDQALSRASALSSVSAQRFVEQAHGNSGTWLRVPLAKPRRKLRSSSLCLNCRVFCSRFFYKGALGQVWEQHKGWSLTLKTWNSP